MSYQRKPCARCGVKREYRKGRGDLCRDCREVLTVNERTVWEKAA